jgi:hypothetical protein
MKKVTLLVVAISFCMVSWAFAAIGKTKTEDSAALRKQQVEQAAREELASKEWIIQVTPKIAKRNEAAETDVLTFTGITVKSRNLSIKGYSESNYALHIEADGTAVWETMQGTKTGDTALLRGELKNDILRGSMSMQPQKGDRTVYLFSSGVPTAIPQTVSTMTTVNKENKGR